MIAVIALAVAAVVITIPTEWVIPAALMVLLGVPAVGLFWVIGSMGPQVRAEAEAFRPPYVVDLGGAADRPMS